MWLGNSYFYSRHFSEIDNHGGILYVDQELKVQFKFLIPRDDVDRKSLVRPKNRELYPRRSEGGDDQ